jgi:hypothetical protein
MAREGRTRRITGIGSGEYLPQSLRPIINAIGEQKALELVSALGGTVVYVPRSPRGNTLLVRAIGLQAAKRLGREFGGGHLELPLAGKAVAVWLKGKGLSNAEIARIQRCSTRTVANRVQTAATRQLTFRF